LKLFARVRAGRPHPAEWNTRWLVALCEWRRWRRRGFNRWATLCILVTSLNRIR